MADSIMLVCAVLASLAAGVLVAYWVVLGMFAAFRIHAEARQAEAKSAAVRVPSVVQS